VSLEVSSLDAVVGGSIDVLAGIDPGSGAPVDYTWTASAGTFEDPSARTTTYICPRARDAGPQLIRVSVSRGPCTVSQPVVVICFAPIVDAGAGGASGGEGTGGAPGITDAGDASDGTMLGCGNDPTVDESLTCDQCTTANCTISENARRGVPPTAGCHHLT
jgi:hypothetical protein